MLIREIPVSVENTIVSPLHVGIPGGAASQRILGGLPSMEVVLSLPPAQYAIERLSGDQVNPNAFSLAGIGLVVPECRS